MAAHVPAADAAEQKPEAPAAAVTSESVSVPMQAPPRTESQEVPEVPSTDVVKAGER